MSAPIGHPVDASVRDELRQVTSRFLASAASSERIRAVAGSGGVPDRKLVSGATEMGWFGLEIPERLGGSGAGFTELVILLEEVGARAASLPLLSSAVLCAGAVLLGGSPEQHDRWLPALAGGRWYGTLVLPHATGRPAGRPADLISAHSDGAKVRLDGHCGYVLDARSSDVLVVAARSGSGEPMVVLLERHSTGVSVEPVEMTDGTRCVDRLRFDRVAVPEEDVLARGDRARMLVDAVLNRASVAVAADAVGIARQVLDLTVSYVRQRRQFGRAIGSFQAVKHQAADVFVELETSRVLVDHAARAVELDPAAGGTRVAASMAKAHAAEKAARAAGVAVQLHGGIGYTWDHDLHLYLKRAKLDEQLFGDARWHRRRVAAHLLDQASKIEEVPCETR